MEASSPLAAVQRSMPAPSSMSWAAKEIFRSPLYKKVPATGPRGLREHLASKGASELLAGKEARVSPAASLAADISQNFHLDNELSPKPPTPRRALFTANVISGLSRRSFMSTPCLASSSPAPLTEILDNSPLPHRAPFSALLEITSPSPATNAPKETSIVDSPGPPSRRTSLELAKPPNSERKKFVATRPIPNRLKGFLAGTMAKSFSSSDSRLSMSPSAADLKSSTLSLEECFGTESPPQDGRRSTITSSPCPSIPLIRQRTQFAGVGGSSRHVSPSIHHARRNSNPLRMKKQLRRSLSMFESPSDVMKSKLETTPVNNVLKTICDMEEPHEPMLPHFKADDPADTIPRISRETMLEILDGRYGDKFDHRMVIDCRFEYEYKGGHIDGAVNHNDKELLSRQLFQTPMEGTSLLIFHCEYSAHRAPLMAKHIRSQDRHINAENYPRLTYPEIYILDGGYSGFWAQHPARCFPPEYVEMSDEKHQRTCEREMGRLKARKGLGRAQTFAAFGKRDSSVFDSPTGPSKAHSRKDNATLNALNASPVFDDRGRNRRLASY